ncbi:hypothetical protein FZC33_04075 [Labrys sp. KNU-23]|uniref:hypothetical protein n=1 Tax=Labrys sp. KNU-23 TaxID=2789216 RepID=UPI0011F05785|nr:hypothetical protein [Labrys sp. KNU-23]QEN85431.1 hypothetical protein FZC33_04075 [Labrys sp. KNU-23]
MEPVPVPAQPAVERKGEAVASPPAETRGKARDEEDTKSAVKRGRKVAKAPVLQPEEAKASPVKKARKHKASREAPLSVQSQAVLEEEPQNDQERQSALDHRKETSAVLRKSVSSPSSFPDEVVEAEVEEGGRRPLSARAARSAAKPGERWTCRLRHVRRNLGSGRSG